MKKISYITILAMLLLFSCSKEQVLQPVSNSGEATPSMMMIGDSDGDDTNADDKKGKDDDTSSSKGDAGSGKSNDGDITDPEKDDGKDKSNKKSKN